MITTAANMIMAVRLVLIPLIAFLGVVAGAILNNVWGRHSAKKAPKTQMRAEAYRDFVVQILQTATKPPYVVVANDPELLKVLARVIVFGETKVIASVNSLLSASNPDFHKSFCEVVCSMRKSLVTGSGAMVSQNIEELLKTVIPTSEGRV